MHSLRRAQQQPSAAAIRLALAAWRQDTLASVQLRCSNKLMLSWRMVRTETRCQRRGRWVVVWGVESTWKADTVALFRSLVALQMGA